MAHAELLKVRHRMLAIEARLLRRKEINARKWIKRIKKEQDESKRKYEYLLRRGYNPEIQQDVKLRRMKVVKPEARAAHLARGYIYDMPYRSMEKVAYTSPRWQSVWRNITKLGGIEDTKENQDKFLAWADVPSTELTKHNQRADYTSHLREPKPSILIVPVLKRI